MDGNGDGNGGDKHRRRYQRERPEDGWRDPLWERQEKEPPRAFEAFGAYRMLGPGRSIQATAKLLGKHIGTLQPWSTRWGWVERVAAWDDEADRLLRERDLVERAEAIRQMHENHATLGRAFTTVSAQALSEYGGETPTAKKRMGELAPADLARFAEVGAKLELRARGEATERIDVKEAAAWMDSFIELALGYLPAEHHEAFLTDLETRLGVGGFAG